MGPLVESPFVDPSIYRSSLPASKQRWKTLKCLLDALPLVSFRLAAWFHYQHTITFPFGCRNVSSPDHCNACDSLFGLQTKSWRWIYVFRLNYGLL